MSILKLPISAFARAAGSVAALSVLTALVSGQSAAPPSPAKPPMTAQGEDEAVRLNEFIVTDSQDIGYSTTNAIGVTRTNTALIDTPTTINVINRQFMEDFQVGELFDALKYVAAVTIESNVGDSTMIRGYTVRDQYTDGMVDNQNQSQAGAEPFQFERIEVMKGPNALVYGSTAIGGVTNRVRKAPQFKPAGMVGLTLGNHNQLKTEFDYTAPLTKNMAYRLIAVYRSEDLVNGVNARFANFWRWNVNPMVTYRVNATSRIRVVGEFMTEQGYKHWGENGMFQPFTPIRRTGITTFGVRPENGGISTFGLLPRDFTFGEEQGESRNTKQSATVYYETSPIRDLSIRLTGTASWWYHDVEDIIPIGMAANNREMTRLWRTITNDDFYATAAMDAVYNVKIGKTEHKLLGIFQYTKKDRYQNIVNNNPSTLGPGTIPNLDIFDPIYRPYTPPNPIFSNRQYGQDRNHNVSFQDHAKFFGDKLQLVGGARNDTFTTHTDNNLTGARGALNRGKKWTYKYGAIIKLLPSYSLFYNHSETYSPVFGTQPDGSRLPHQEGVIEEAGLKMNFFQGRVSGTLSAYDLKLENLLNPDPDPVRAAAGWRVPTALQQTKGIEADAFITATKNWQFNVGGAQMRVTTPNGLMPRNSPRYTGNFATRYRFSDGMLKGFAMGGGITWKGKAPVDALNSYSLDKYWVSDVWVNYGWRKYRFQLNVSNVTDRFYLQRSVSKEQVFQGPERLIKFRVTRTF
jgi:iron complex outermembrane receptor protein